MRSNRLLLLAFLSSLQFGCSAELDESELVGDGDFERDKADVVYKYLAYKTVTSATQFKGMSFSGGVALQGPSVKFLIDNRKPQTPVVYFQNARYKQNGQTPLSAKYHFYFAQAALAAFSESGESFNQTTYYQQSKRYFAGTIQAYQLKAGAAPLYGIQLYPEDVAAEATLLTAVSAVKKGFKIPSAKLALVATGPQQTTATIGPQLAALGVEATTVDKILGAVTYLPMSPGEAWGYLRIFPASPDERSPLDIPVYQELPLDLAVVAGVITKAFQDASCHVNLKSKERGTPDMVLRDASPQHPQLAPLDGVAAPIKLYHDFVALPANTDLRASPVVPGVWCANRSTRTCPNRPSGRMVARTGLRMMPTFPPPSLKFRTAGFPQYGFKAGLSDEAFPPRTPVKPAPGIPIVH